RRPKRHDVESGKQAKHQREDELDANLRSSLFRALPSLRTRDVRVRSECLSDARAKSIRLNQHRDERSNVVNFRAISEILESFNAGLPGSDFARNHPELLGERRMGESQFFARLQDGLIECRASLEADDKQVQGVGESVFDTFLAQLNPVLDPETRKQVCNDR